MIMMTTIVSIIGVVSIIRVISITGVIRIISITTARQIIQVDKSLFAFPRCQEIFLGPYPLFICCEKKQQVNKHAGSVHCAG